MWLNLLEVYQSLSTVLFKMIVRGNDKMSTFMTLVLSLAAVFCAVGRSLAEDVPGIMKLPVSRITRNGTLDKRQIGTNLDNTHYGTLYIVDSE